MGLIDIIQDPNKNESKIEEVSSSFWNSEIDQIFTPAAAVQTSEKNPKSRAITSHRLLTSSAILEEKRKKIEEKQKLEEKKERKRKREEKQGIKEMQGKLKKT